MGDLWGVNAEEADAELGLVGGDGRDGVAVADALDLGNEGEGGGGKGGTEKEDRIADGKSSVADTQFQTAYRWKSHLLHAPANL